MKADRAVLEEPIEGRGQNVLPGVLLHVIEAARPVEFGANDCALGDRRRKNVHDVIVDIDCLDDVNREPKKSAPLLTRITRPTHFTRPAHLKELARIEGLAT
jgi:hypothetical protein